MRDTLQSRYGSDEFIQGIMTHSMTYWKFNSRLIASESIYLLLFLTFIAGD